jgi:hypothetical protein
LFSSLQKNPESTTNSQQAGLSIVFLVSKVAKKNEEATQKSEHRRKIKGNHRRGSISTASVFDLQHQISKTLPLAVC